MAVLLAGGGSCDKKKAKPEPPEHFELTSRGHKAGRRLLAYRFRRGQVVRYRSIQRVSLAGGGGGGRETESVIQLRVVESNPSGALLLSRFLDLKGVPAGVRARALGTRTLLRFSPSGRLSSSKTVGTGVVAAASRRLGRGLQRALNPLPTVPVGPGARWRARSFPTFPGPGGVPLRTKLEAHYELKRFGRCGKVACATIGVDLVVRVLGSKKKIVVKGWGRGGGEVQLDLDDGVLLSSKVQCLYNVSVRAGGRRQEMRLVLAWETVRSR